MGQGEGNTFQGKRTGYAKVHQCAAAAKSLQSCPTLCDPIDGSPPGSPVPVILQARVVECGAIAFSGVCVECLQLEL